MPGGGPHPHDPELFAPAHLPRLRVAARELGWLRERGYPLPSALKLVGDHHQLRERQRVAISRATSEAATAAVRGPRRVPPGAAPPPGLHVDGFNAVITCETALRGGVLVTTTDGGLRDLAGVHGTYRVSEVTAAAIALLAARLAERGWAAVPTRWLLDAPVSNSGRLADRLRAEAGARGLPWTVEVVPDPDVELGTLPAGHVAASGDAPVLDRCQAWVDLASEAVRSGVPQAWVLDLELG